MKNIIPNPHTTGKPHRLGVRFPYTNDPELAKKHKELRRFNESASTQAERATVIIGNGGLLSFADVLPDIVYVTDRSAGMLDWMATCIRILIDEPAPHSFIKALGIWRRNYSSTEIKSFKRLHFLDSIDRYKASQQAMANKAIQYIQMDYGDPADIKSLGEDIRTGGRSLAIFNATNVHEYIDSIPLSDYFAALSVLPWADDYRILASCKFRPGLVLPAFSSVANYQKAIV